MLCGKKWKNGIKKAFKRMEVIFKNNEFTIKFTTGKIIVLTWEEWMEMRKMQNFLIYTEPV